ncbi:hypothetical protein [Dactylosporangium sp. CA-092794]|uniref:hypothetical protein n=1 Tax=Dactylosporangium sp. CA-092794 TaxID=3239929 RepID=UPI003D8A1350
MRYLADTSALVRLQREQALPVRDDLVERGLIAVCEPTMTEAMKLAAAKEYLAVEDQIRAGRR